MESSSVSQVSSYIINGKRKLYYTFSDSNSQMVEEYNMKTHELLSRVWKKKAKLSNFEVPEIGKLDNLSKPNDVIQLSSSNVGKDTWVTTSLHCLGKIALSVLSIKLGIWRDIRRIILWFPYAVLMT